MAHVYVNGFYYFFILPPPYREFKYLEQQSSHDNSTDSDYIGRYSKFFQFPQTFPLRLMYFPATQPQSRFLSKI